jgi:hypothetical protein
VSELQFQTPWDKPVDPTYEKFESGWHKWVEDGGLFRFPGVRWNPGKGDWFTYPAPRWEMIDRPVPAFKPPDSLFGLTLPQVFVHVLHEAKQFPQYPNLIWNPYSGEWRQARDTTGGGDPPRIPGPVQPPASADAAKLRAYADREREINEVYAQYARHAIDLLTLNQRIAEIDARYAPLLG